MLTLEDIGQKLDSLYLPFPGEAEKERPRKAIQRKSAASQVNPGQLTPPGVILRQDPSHVIIQGDVIWESAGLETHGFTHQDAFVGITVFSDSLAGNVLASWQPLFTVELQGSCGSPWTTLDSFVAVSNGRTGTFEIATLRAASNSLETRVVIYAADNVNWVPPGLGRIVDFSVDGLLIAGYEM